MKQRVLITGGAGLIGSTIADMLSAKQVYEIVVYDNLERGRLENLESALKRGGVDFVEGDIRDRALLFDTMEGIDVVYHMAAIRITQCAEDPMLAMEVMADGTFNVLDAAVAASVEKVVAASSASVYGLAETFPTPERHHPYNDRTLYGASKIFSEALLRAFNEMYNLDYLALRFFNVYGPRMDVHGAYTEVLIRWMERVDAGLPPLIFGDGSQTMDFVYIDDVSRACILAGESTASDDVFNIASGVETSLSELAAALIHAMGAELSAEHVDERKVNPVSRRLADTSRAREVLGFETQVPLSDGLSRLVAWWRAHRAATERTT